MIMKAHWSITDVPSNSMRKHVAARYQSRKTVYRELKKYRGLADYDTALRADPSDVYVYRSRGWLYEKQGQRDLRARRL